MAIRPHAWVLSVLLTACVLDQGTPQPTPSSPTDPDVNDLEVSTSNAMHFSECTLATPDCLGQIGVVGFWSCPSQKGYDFAVGEDGRIEVLNHNGSHGIGCGSCDGSFELVSDQDNLGAAWVKVDGKLSVSGTELKVSWRECGALDIETCRQNPGATRNETCKSSE